MIEPKYLKLSLNSANPVQSTRNRDVSAAALYKYNPTKFQMSKKVNRPKKKRFANFSTLVYDSEYKNTASKLGKHTHWAPKPRTSAVLFCLLAKEARTKQGEYGALVVKGHFSNPWYRPRPLPAAPLVVRRRYLAVVPRPMPAAPLVVRRRDLTVVPRPLSLCALQVLDRGAQADARGAAQVLDRGAQAVASGAAHCTSQVFGRGAQANARGAARCASPPVLDHGAQAAVRGAARCASQVLGRGAQAIVRGAARGASQVLGRGAQAVARGAATLPQQEKNN
jgi:hypothetical protein